MASMLIYNGVDLVTVSHRLGHDQVSTTTNIYSHMIADADSRSADVIADALTLKKAWKRGISQASWIFVELWKRACFFRCIKMQKKTLFQYETVRNRVFYASEWLDLNQRPLGPEPSTLPNWATPRRANIVYHKRSPLSILFCKFFRIHFSVSPPASLLLFLPYKIHAERL